MVVFDHHKQAKFWEAACWDDHRKMDFNGAIISTVDRARRKIIQGKLISRVRLCDGKSERSINNGTIVSRRAVYEVPFVYPLNVYVGMKCNRICYRGWCLMQTAAQLFTVRFLCASCVQLHVVLSISTIVIIAKSKIQLEKYNK